MLNDRQIPKLPKGRPSDARGLYLVVSASVTQKWVYRCRMDGKSHDLGLRFLPANLPQTSPPTTRLLEEYQLRNAICTYPDDCILPKIIPQTCGRFARNAERKKAGFPYPFT